MTDATAASVPNAKMEALNTATNVVRQTQTDERGGYLFSDLLPGTYTVTISAPAFSTRVTDRVVIELNSVRRLDAALAVSQITETVNVAANSVTLQTDRADVNHQIRASQIADLPLINTQGRNFQVLFKILPGFTCVG